MIDKTLELYLQPEHIRLLAQCVTFSSAEPDVFEKVKQINMKQLSSMLEFFAGEPVDAEGAVKMSIKRSLLGDLMGVLFAWDADAMDRYNLGVVQALASALKGLYVESGKEGGSTVLRTAVADGTPMDLHALCYALNEFKPICEREAQQDNGDVAVVDGSKAFGGKLKIIVSVFERATAVEAALGSGKKPRFDLNIAEWRVCREALLYVLGKVQRDWSEDLKKSGIKRQRFIDTLARVSHEFRKEGRE